MKNINTYIIEKFKIAKDIKTRLNWQDDKEEMGKYIANKIKEMEDKELDLADVFDDIKKYDDNNNQIETLYYEGDDFAYSYYEDFERYKLIDDLSDLFTGDDIQEIYDYLFNNE